MNLRWLKRNLVAVIFVSVYVLLLGAIVWLAQQAAKLKTNVEADLTAQSEALKQVQSLAIYPSPDNIRMLQSQRHEVQKLYATLQEALTNGGLSVTNSQNEIEFVDRLRKTQDELNQLASKGSVLIVSNFAYGFSRYNDTFPCRNPSVNPDECRRILSSLSKELAIVAKLTGVAINSHVDSIVAIRRIEVEQIGAGGAPTPDTLPGPIPEDARARYRLLPFDLQILCSGDALKEFLNNLAQSDWFFMVEVVTVTKASIALGTTGAPVAPPTGASKTTGGTAERSPLLVNMRIDLVEFPNPKATR